MVVCITSLNPARRGAAHSHGIKLWIHALRPHLVASRPHKPVHPCTIDPAQQRCAVEERAIVKLKGRRGGEMFG
jgi:hypothetical protein